MSTAASSTTWSTRSSRRRAPWSSTTTSRAASSRPSRAANASRPWRAAFGTAAVNIPPARRGLRVTTSAAAAPATLSAAETSAYPSTGPAPSDRSRGTDASAVRGSSAGPSQRSGSRRSHARRFARSSPKWLARCVMSVTKVSGPCDSDCTKALVTPSPRSVRATPTCCSRKRRTRGSFSMSATSEPSSAGMGVNRSSWPNTPPLRATTSAPMAMACRRNGSMSPGCSGRSWEKRSLWTSCASSTPSMTSSRSSTEGPSGSNATTTRPATAFTCAHFTPSTTCSARSTSRAKTSRPGL